MFSVNKYMEGTDKGKLSETASDTAISSKEIHVPLSHIGNGIIWRNKQSLLGAGCSI